MKFEAIFLIILGISCTRGVAQNASTAAVFDAHPVLTHPVREYQTRVAFLHINTVADYPRQDAEFESDILQEARRQGLEVTGVESESVRLTDAASKPFQTYVAFQYRADRELSFGAETLHEGKNHCFYDLADRINELRPQMTRPPFLVFIEWAKDSTSTALLSLFGPADHSLKLESARDYDFREACEIERASTLRHYREGLGREALEAVCVCGPSDSWDLMVIENTTPNFPR